MNDGVVAVDIGGTSTKVAFVSRDGGIEHWRRFATRAPVALYRERLVQEVLAVRQQAGQVAGIAFGIAGFVSSDGTLLYNGNLPWLEGHSVRAWLAEVEGPILVESDSNTACAGEAMFGVEAGSPERLLCLTAGTGLGVGAMVAGQLQRTAFGCLGDAGHVIVEPDGPACTCGGRGCAEAVLSTRTLGRQYGKSGFRSLVADVAAGSCAAVAVAERAGGALGLAMASLANIFIPDRVVIAGGLAHLGAPLLQAADLSFRRHAGDFITQRAQVVLASTGSDATLLGAAACFFAGVGGAS